MADEFNNTGHFFSPAAMMWRVHREAILLLAGGRALLMQIAHPKIAAGVSDHSSFHDDPLGRLQRTTEALWSIIFDEKSVAQAAVNGVKRVHQRVHGAVGAAEPLPAGTPYDAFDEELLLWVHATLIDAAIQSYELFVRPMTVNEKACYYEESKTLARLFDIPEALIPQSLPEFNVYMVSTIESSAIAVGTAAQTIAQDIIYPTPWILKPGAPVHRLATAGLLPAKLRRAYGLQWSDRRKNLFLLMARLIRGLLPLTPRFLRIVPNARRSEQRLRLSR
ncbi:MAG TPA: oxygenase MpaB family protein [Candidatus Binatia bacterium]